ncbi:hypothetical protein GCM10027082_24210 [Comamonas humi]
MSSLTATLRDAPTKMTAEGITAAEQKFTTILGKQFPSQDQLQRAHKAYHTAIDGDVPLGNEAQRLAKAFHAACLQATQVALGGYKPSEETRFDVRVS